MRIDIQTQEIPNSDMRTYKYTKVLSTSLGLTVPVSPEQQEPPQQKQSASLPPLPLWESFHHKETTPTEALC